MTILKKFENEREEPRHFWKSKKIIFSVGVGLFILILSEIWVAHTLAISGVKLQEIKNLQKELTLENQLLRDEIASQSALNKIASQSALLGLTHPSDIQYIH